MKIYQRDDLRAIADRRTSLHKGSKKKMNLGNDSDYVGICGEYAFSLEFDLPLDVSERPDGDYGIDFTLANGMTVDVKTYRKPNNLFREIDKQHDADVLVLAGYDEEHEDAYLIGWEYSANMLDCPAKDFGHGIVNHYKAATSLRPISDLHNIVVRDMRMMIELLVR